MTACACVLPGWRAAGRRLPAADGGRDRCRCRTPRRLPRLAGPQERTRRQRRCWRGRPPPCCRPLIACGWVFLSHVWVLSCHLIRVQPIFHIFQYSVQFISRFTLDKIVSWQESGFTQQNWILTVTFWAYSYPKHENVPYGLSKQPLNNVYLLKENLVVLILNCSSKTNAGENPCCILLVVATNRKTYITSTKCWKSWICMFLYIAQLLLKQAYRASVLVHIGECPLKYSIPKKPTLKYPLE